MARFRATIQGQRGRASRLGSAKSGIVAQVNGWDAGITVNVSTCGPGDGSDKWEIYQTGGSNHRTSPRHLGTLTVDCTGIVTWEPC